MAYTIKGLAKANECETHDANGLAQIWNYWYICNCGGRKTIISDFKSLQIKERGVMIHFLQENGFSDIEKYIIDNCLL